MNTALCKNCGNRFEGNFCNNCGQKKYAEHDKSLGHFFDEGFHFITHIDNKFFKTLFLILRKPGLVSLEFSAGATQKYYKPVSLFLIGVVLYLIFPLLQGLNVTFSNHIMQQKFLQIGFLQNWAEIKAARQGISLTQLAVNFDTSSPKASKLLLFAILPLTGLGLAGMFRRRKKFFYDHFILSAELNTFYLYLTFFILPLLFLTLREVLHLFGFRGDFYLGDLISLVLHFVALYLAAFFSFKRFYGLKSYAAYLKPILFLFVHFIIVYILYRLILFSVVMLLI